MEFSGHKDNPVIQFINPIYNRWLVSWRKDTTDTNDNVTFVAEIFDHKPNINEIKDAIESYYNQIVQEKIRQEFKWKEYNIWLSLENQINYKSIYDLIENKTLEKPPIIKVYKELKDTYYQFESLQEFKDFYSAVNLFIKNTLESYWWIKDNIKYDEYEELLNSL